MANKVMNYVKGAAAGVAVTTAVSMIVAGASKKSSKGKAKLKKGAGKAIKAVGSIVDTVQNMMH